MISVGVVSIQLSSDGMKRSQLDFMSGSAPKSLVLNKNMDTGSVWAHRCLVPVLERTGSTPLCVHDAVGHLLGALLSSWQSAAATLLSSSAPPRGLKRSCRFLSSRTHGCTAPARWNAAASFTSEAAGVSAHTLTQSTCTQETQVTCDHRCSISCVSNMRKS